jgi:hypothetical protein
MTQKKNLKKGIRIRILAAKRHIRHKKDILNHGILGLRRKRPRIATKMHKRNTFYRSARR